MKQLHVGLLLLAPARARVGERERRRERGREGGRERVRGGEGETGKVGEGESRRGGEAGEAFLLPSFRASRGRKAQARFLAAIICVLVNYDYRENGKGGDEKRGDRTSKQKYTTNKHKQT